MSEQPSADPSTWETGLRRASVWLACIGAGAAFAALPLADLRLTTIGVALVFASLATNVAWGRLARKRWAAREAWRDQQTTEALADLRVALRKHGHELPSEVTDEDVKRAMVYLAFGGPLHIDGEPACQCEALAIVAPAAVKAREIAARSGKPPRKWTPHIVEEIV